MRKPPFAGKTLPWFLLFLLLPLAGGAQARGMSFGVDSVRSPAGSMQGVQARLEWSDGAALGQLELRISRLDFPPLSHRLDDVVWRCALQPDGAGQWDCAGPVQARGAPERQLALTISPAGTRAVLDGGGTRLSYENQAASPDLSRVELQRVPVAWLKAYLASLWADGQWTSGTLDGRVDVLAADAGLVIDADLALADLGLETPDGTVAAAGLAGQLALDYRDRAGQPEVDVELTTRAGEFLFDTLYVQLPTSPVTLRLAAVGEAGGGWRVPRLEWRDGDVLHLSGNATLAADASVRDLLLDLHFGDLAIARDRYLSGFLAPTGFGELVLSGAAGARIHLQDGRLRELALSPAGVNAIDPGQRFTLAGLHGDLAWRADGNGPAGSLAWDSGALFGIGIKAATLPFASAGGELKLASPVRVGVLGGTIAIDDLRWQPPDDGHGTRFQLGVTMDQLDLASLSQRLGWPAFAGTLGGRIPSARFQDNILTLDGGLTFQLFGGTVALSQLVLERPFGVAPSLSADVAIADIDLEPLTDAFGFGTITGRLDGRIDAIRMVDWQAVAFDARLDTDPSWKGRRRISQRAIEDISNVGGGGGLMGGLQAQALRFFDDFGYSRIGLGCRLRGDVCTMSGLDSAGDRYTIVEGAGLPRVTVVGHRRLVDWPTLVERLQVATEGQAPIIQ